MSVSATIVFDAFGTLVQVRDVRRPFARLRAWLALQGVQTQDLPHQAMAHPHSLESLAARAGVPLPAEFAAQLQDDLAAELASIAWFPEAPAVLAALLRAKMRIVIASNLAHPYGPAVQALAATVAPVGRLGSQAAIETAWSYDVGHLKPAPAFYALVASATPNPVIAMVGDRWEEDVAGPRRAGWASWHLRRAQGQRLWDAPWAAWIGRGL